MSHANPMTETAEQLVGAGADWTPERQTAHMLDLCEAQMEAALQESDTAVDALVQAFTSMVDTARSVSELASTLPPSDEQRALVDIGQHCQQMTRQMASAVVAFQFYDKLTQRLGHVRYSLSTLAMFVCNPAQTAQQDQWKKLFGTLRRLYRTEEERAIFQLVANGVSADEARIQVTQEKAAQAPAPAGEIELF
jgi:ribosomal protein L16 Arg81 hydroxylase